MKETDTLDQPLEVARPKRRRWRYWLGIPLALLVLWLAILYVCFLYLSDRELQEAIAEAERDSPAGWQLGDVEAHRERVPDEENAALVVVKLKSLLPANWPVRVASPGATDAEDEDGAAAVPGRSWVDRLDDLAPEVALPEDLLRRLRASLAQVEPARAEAHKLIGMTRGRYPLQWKDNVFETVLSSQESRTAARLLRYEAVLASQDGDADAAVASVRGIVAAARSVGDEPFLISVLIRLADDMQAVATLERVLAQGEPSARALEAVQELLEQEAAEPLLLRGMRGERAGMHKMLLDLRSGAVNLSQITGGPGGVEKGVTRLVGPTLARRSHAPMLRLLNESVAAAQLPPEEQLPAMKAVEKKTFQARQDYDVVTALMMPAVIKVTEAYRRGVGNLRCAAVAVALERYRRDHGGWPETLDALVPRHLAAVPADPQDGKPLRFRHRPDGVVVYWLGPDGTDDGGKLERRNYLAKGTDQGFQLWDVSRRRQEVPEVLPPPTVRPVP
jgi:hypothetical protein